MSTPPAPELPKQHGEQPPRTANPPFNKPTANVIIRSSDRVDFYLQKAIMQEASSLFEDMFSLPQPPPDAINERKRKERDEDQFVGETPVITVTEDSETLNYLLLFCYPAKRPHVANEETLFKVFEASKKYLMEYIVEEVTQLLLNRIEHSVSPLDMYFFASKYRFEEGLDMAARMCLKIDLLSVPDTPPSAASVDAATYMRLLRFYKQHKAVVVDTLKPREMIGYADSLVLDWFEFVTIDSASSLPAYLRPCRHDVVNSLPGLSGLATSVPRNSPTILFGQKGVVGRVQSPLNTWFLPYIHELADKFATRPCVSTLTPFKSLQHTSKYLKYCSACYSADIQSCLNQFIDGLHQYALQKQSKITF